MTFARRMGKYGVSPMWPSHPGTPFTETWADRRITLSFHRRISISLVSPSAGAASVQAVAEGVRDVRGIYFFECHLRFCIPRELVVVGCLRVLLHIYVTTWTTWIA